MSAVETFEIVLALLLVVVALHWAALKLGLPPAAALLAGGGMLAFVPGLPPVELSPRAGVDLFLPPLLMDGAYYTALGRFRRHLPGILGLAVGAVVFTTLAVGLGRSLARPDSAVGRLFRTRRYRVAARRRVGARGAAAGEAPAAAGGAARRRKPAKRRYRAGAVPLRGRRDLERHVRRRRRGSGISCGWPSAARWSGSGWRPAGCSVIKRLKIRP